MMKSDWMKRVIAWLLLICMMTTIVPVQAFAATGGDTQNPGTESEPAPEVPTEGDPDAGVQPAAEPATYSAQVTLKWEGLPDGESAPDVTGKLWVLNNVGQILSPQPAISVVEGGEAGTYICTISGLTNTDGQNYLLQVSDGDNYTLTASNGGVQLILKLSDGSYYADGGAYIKAVYIEPSATATFTVK